MKRTLFLIPAAVGLLALLLDAPVSGRGDDEDVAELIQRSFKLARDKKFDEALETIHKVLKKEPNNDRALMVASDIERRAGRFADGLQHAKDAIKINDKVGLYYALVAANAYGNEEPELALEYCRKVLDMGPSKAGESVYKDAKLYEDLLLKKTYTITWNLDPSDPMHRAFVRDYLPIALPKDGLPYQSVAVQIKGAKSYRIIKGEANDVANVVPNGDKKSPKQFQVITKVTLQPISYKAKLAKAAEMKGAVVLPLNVRGYLGKAHGFDPQSPVLKKIAAEVKGSSSVETVRNLLAWLKKNVKYKDESSDISKLDFDDVDDIVKRGHAECRGYTMLFAALCRAAGIPARPIWGVLFAEQTFKSHNWDEVYIVGVGWVPVDPQAAETFGWLPINRVRTFMDLRKSADSPEHLPLMNLIFMNGKKLQYEQSR